MKSGARETRAVTFFTYSYLVLPFIIFAIGWMRIYIWIPVVIAVLFSAWKAWKGTPTFWCPEFNKENV